MASRTVFVTKLTATTAHERLGLPSVDPHFGGKHLSLLTAMPLPQLELAITIVRLETTHEVTTKHLSELLYRRTKEPNFNCYRQKPVVDGADMTNTIVSVDTNTSIGDGFSDGFIKKTILKRINGTTLLKLRNFNSTNNTNIWFR